MIRYEIVNNEIIKQRNSVVSYSLFPCRLSKYGGWAREKSKVMSVRVRFIAMKKSFSLQIIGQLLLYYANTTNGST